MSTLVKRIEKEFFLKMLHVEQIPIVYYRGRDEYILFLKIATKDILIFSVNHSMLDLNIDKKINLMFKYREDAMVFEVNILDLREGEIICGVPEAIRKNLDRSNIRISPPPNIDIKVSFFEDRFNLPLPRLRKYHPIIWNLADFSNVKEDVKKLVEDGGYDYKMAVFGKGELSTMEEKVIAHTGKIFFMPDVEQGFPTEDPSDKDRIVTLEEFHRYLFEDRGIDGVSANTVTATFVREKKRSKIISDIWVPMILQEYVFGYIRVSSNDAGRPAISDATIDKLHGYAELMAQVFVRKGQFEKMKMGTGHFDTYVRDISVSGMLFTCPFPDIAIKLIPGCDLRVNISFASNPRVLDLKTRIVRLQREWPDIFAACSFEDMSDEDAKLLSEYIYARNKDAETEGAPVNSSTDLIAFS